MFKYSERSLKVRSELHPQLQKIFDFVLPIFDHTLVCGYRPQEEQDKAFENGFSKVKFPYGKHNRYPSIAVDAYPYPLKDLHAKSAREQELYQTCAKNPVIHDGDVSARRSRSYSVFCI